MTEREKMAQIIAEHLCPQGKAHKTLYGAERRCYSRNNFADCENVSECVDALIEAGIGDMTEWKERAKKHRFMALPDGRLKQLYSDEEVEDIARQRNEWKERAEKAEKERDEYRKSTHIALRGIEILKRNILRYFVTEFPNILQQAEREIEEEKGK